MTDAVVNILAVDHFDLGSNWIPQNSTVTNSQDHAEMVKANGDYQKFSSVFNVMTSYTVEYKWNADTGLGAALPHVGSVENTIHIDSITINTVYNDYPTITISGHNHAENAHTDNRTEYAPYSSIVSALNGTVGAVDFFGKASTTVCATESSYTLSCTHVDVECGTGNHFVGNNVLGIEEASVTYVGDSWTPRTSPTVSGWTVTSAETTDSNQEFDTSVITATKLVTRE